MKMKYFAAVALLLWLGVTGWLASMVIVKPVVLRVGAGAEETEEMAQTRAAIARNRQIQQQLEASSGVSTLSAVGPLIALPDANARPQQALAAELPPLPSVSLVITASGYRSAVVNGEHVRVGQRVDSGARVRAIGPNWVRVDDPVHGSQTLVVADPIRPAGRSQQ